MSGVEGSGDHTSRDDLRMGLYELLYEQVEYERQWRLRRMTAGLGVIGIIIGYALLAGRLRVIALTPILYGIVVMVGLKSTVEILYLHRHMARIEDALAEREPLFNWISEYGTFGDGQALYVADVNLDLIPNVALYALVGSAYLGLVAVSLLTWTPVRGATTLGGPITRWFLLAGYVAFTVMFGLIAAVTYLHFRRLDEEG